MDENFQQNDLQQGNYQNQSGQRYNYPQMNLNLQNNLIPPDYSKTVTMGDWLIYTLLAAIPLVNLVALIYFALDHEKPSRANLARLALIFFAIAILLVVLLVFAGCSLALLGANAGL